MKDFEDGIRLLPARQQPAWPDPDETRRVADKIVALPPLVTAAETETLRRRLALVAAGRCLVIQAGDCAEDWAECTPRVIAAKCDMLRDLAAALQRRTGLPVLRVGRIAGQFAKPRSRPTETVGGRELPVYRGHMVNAPEPDPELRTPDPARMLAGYHAAQRAMQFLGWGGPDSPPRPYPSPWTSHEALLLDYEIPMLRREPRDTLLLTSTHWPWIGDRTRQVDGAHVRLLAAVGNPVACKVGPTATLDDVLGLCERLDPHRRPGRLTLIARMGADLVGERLPALVEGVRRAGHPVIWMTDPMHGNTVTAASGQKTRCVSTVVREVTTFRRVVTEAGGVAGGLHLEATPHDVTECVADESRLDDLTTRYTTLCDPRLNLRQAREVVSAW